MKGQKGEGREGGDKSEEALNGKGKWGGGGVGARVVPKLNHRRLSVKSERAGDTVNNIVALYNSSSPFSLSFFFFEGESLFPVFISFGGT